MKKTYMTPEVISYRLMGNADLLTGSITSNRGIGYGGVDKNGEYKAESRSAVRLTDLNDLDDFDE